MALTTKEIRDAVEAGQRAELWDDAGKHRVPALHVLVTPAGCATFYIRYRVAAGHRRFKLGRYGSALTIEQARKLARARLAEVEAGRDPQAERARSRDGLTVSAAFDKFIKAPSEKTGDPRKPRTVDLYRQLFRDYLARPLGRLRVEAVEPKHARRIKGDVAAEVGHEVANRALALLSAVMEATELWGERPKHSNPCSGVARFKEEGRERFLRAEERAALVDALADAEDLSPGAVLCVRLLALTGCRRSEIEGLTWGMVDTHASVLRLPDSKTGKKTVPLTRQASTLLDDVRPEKPRAGDLVCTSAAGTPVRNVGRVWAIVRKRAKLGSVRLHDLRHSFASDALNAGAPLALVGAMLGHRSVRTTQRYAHVANEALQRAVELAGNAIEASAIEGAEVVRLRGEVEPQLKRRRKKARKGR